VTQAIFPPAGTGPGGFSPIAPASPKRTSIPPRALRYNPQTRDFTTTEGLFDAVHPVDQAVVLALTIEQGSIKSVPTLGIPLSTIRRAGGPTLDTLVRDCVNAALKDLLDAKKVEVIRLDTDTVIRGQIKIAVTYRNLVSRRIGTVQTG